MAEMSVIRDGITSNSADLTECAPVTARVPEGWKSPVVPCVSRRMGRYKRHSISVQQQMQSQLTDLREKLTKPGRKSVRFKGPEPAAVRT